jgi:hypothetical protein
MENVRNDNVPNIRYYSSPTQPQRTSRIVTDRPIHINGQSRRQIGEKANRRERNSIHVAHGKAHIDHQTQNNDGNNGRLVSERDSVNHIGRGSRLAGIGHFADGCVTRARVVFRDQTNNETTGHSNPDAKGRMPRHHVNGPVSDGLGQGKGGGQKVVGRVVNGGDHESSGANELQFQGQFDVGFFLDRLDVGGEERTNEANKETHGTDQDGKDHGVPVTVAGQTNAASENQSSASGFGETAKQVRSHASNVTDIVTHIVGNGGWVARVVL